MAKNTKKKLKAPDNFDEEKLPEEGSKFKNTLHTIVSKLSFLKKKKFWIPLLLGHLIMFIGTGYFAVHELTKGNKVNYIISALQDSFEEHDPVLFNSIADINSISNNFIYDFVNEIQKYKHLFVYIGEIPETEIIKDHISLFLLETIRGNQYHNEFYDRTKFIPEDFVEQILNTQYDIVRTDDPEVYKVIATFHDPKWETLQVKLELKKTPDGFKFMKILNLDEIMSVYNYALEKDYQMLQSNKNLINDRISTNIKKYINNPQCSVQLGEIANKKVLFIELTAEPNNANSNVISFAANVRITNDEDEEILHNDLKSNKLFLPKTPIQTSWNIELDEASFNQLAKNKNLICKTHAVMVNAENGDYFDIRKK